LRANDDWKKLSADEQRVKELEDIEVINCKRDKKKEGLMAEWAAQVSSPNLEEKDVDSEVEWMHKNDTNEDKDEDVSLEEEHAEGSLEEGDIDAMDEERWFDKDGNPIGKEQVISNIADVWKARHQDFVHTLDMLERTGQEDEEPCSSEEDEELAVRRKRNLAVPRKRNLAVRRMRNSGCSV